MNEDTKRPTIAAALEHPFDKPGEHSDYAVFPAELEKDPEVFFHGTQQSLLQPIREEGFRMPPPPKARSVSFSRTSGLALGYACDKRSEASPEGVVIAVRFAADNRSERREESFGLHVDRFDPQPEIIGYCIVPAAYDHR
ncbi:hypothetical protein IVB02_18905 [Bradyrhizobium sp. 166]|uniref:hypothetical protein n=1 Tax=Bradyrhizobium sp. 166 TaxID=2782638 RepID=UPI001FF935F1|nr:hypothetical protein [Bradyrhizobium sp. 166]MCK1603454.1 hypothetical protein [Bradyrhizobium sp. 166]